MPPFHSTAASGTLPIGVRFSPAVSGDGRSAAVGTGLVSAGLALLGRLADEVSPVVRPAVAHLDVYLPNILVNPKGVSACF
jgi:hypothetical protein